MNEEEKREFEENKNFLKINTNVFKKFLPKIWFIVFLITISIFSFKRVSQNSGIMVTLLIIIISTSSSTLYFFLERKNLKKRITSLREKE
jgi:hypothetical protein